MSGLLSTLPQERRFGGVRSNSVMALMCSASVVAFCMGSPSEALAQCAVAPGSVNCAVNTTTTDTINDDAANPNSSDFLQRFSTGGSVTGTIQNGVAINGAGLAISTSEAGANVSLNNSGSVTNPSGSVVTGVGAVNLGASTGNVTYTGSGTITGIPGDGLVMTSGGGNISATVNGNVSAATYGVNLAATGNGTVSLAGTGNISGGSANTFTGAIRATSDNGDITIGGSGNTVVSGSGAAIVVEKPNSGLGTITVNRTGTIDNGAGGAIQGDGIFVTSLGVGAGEVKIVGVGAIKSAGYGIRVQSNSDVLVTPGGSINTTGNSTYGMQLGVSSSGNLTVNSAYDITSTNTFPRNSAAIFTGSQDGDTVINITGGTIRTPRFGVFARGNGTGKVTVNMTGGQIGTSANPNGTYVGSYGAGAYGIGAVGLANVDVTSGTIFSVGGLSVNAGGIATVTANGAITASALEAIALTSNTNASTINVNNTLTNDGTRALISATSTGGGSFTIHNNAGGTIQSNAANPETKTAISVTNSAGGNVTLTNAGTMTGQVTIGQGANTFGNSNIWHLGGASNFGTGSTALINSGTMNVTGSALIGGASVTATNSGTLALGSATSVLGFTGTFAFQSSGTYRVNVNPTTSSVTNVTGTASLGGTVNAVFAAGSYLTKQYTILTSTLGRSGMFAGLTTTGAPSGFASSLSYDANNAYLDLSMNAIAVPGSLVINQQAPAQTIANYFNNGGALPPGFTTLAGLTGAQQRQGFAQASGEGSGGAGASATSASNSFINAIIDPSIDGRGNEGGVTSFADETMAYAPSRRLSRETREAYAAVTPRDVRADPFAARWSVWASGYGGASNVSGNASQGTSDTSSRIYGTVVGADYRVGRDTLLGFATGGAGTSFSTGVLGSGRADLFQAGVYGRHNFGAAYLSGALAYGWQDVTTKRTVTVAGTDVLESRFQTNTFSARGEVGYRYVTPFAGFTPYGALQFTDVRLPSYGETAISGSNQFALTFASRTSDNLRSELGLRTDKTFLTADAVLTLRGRVAWAHDSNTSRAIAPTFQALPGSPSFTVNGARPAADGLLATAGAEMKFRNGWTFAANYEGEFSRTTSSNAGKGVLRYAFD